MNVHITQPCSVNGYAIPPGRYQVSVDENAGHVILTNKTGVFQLTASMRSSKVQVKKSSVQLRKVVGELRWLLIVRTPPAIEWVVSLDESTNS